MSDWLLAEGGAQGAALVAGFLFTRRNDPDDKLFPLDLFLEMSRQGSLRSSHIH